MLSIVADDVAPFWADRSFLREVQYLNDRNLAARQSIYAYQLPKLELAPAVLGSLRLAGSEIVADVGCGNGLYLAELGHRDHQGAVLGVDISPGMLAAAESQVLQLPAAQLLVGDATALPLRSGACELTLAMHMLYHVPEPVQAVMELRRVTRPGGRVVIGLNGNDHLLELFDLVNWGLAIAGRTATHPIGERIRLDQGAELLAGFFGSVIRHDLTGELLLPDPQPVADYVSSLSIAQDRPEQDRLVDTVTSRMEFGSDGLFRVRTHSGWLICS